MMHIKNNSKGFSLLELVIGIAIIAIIAGISVATFAKFSRSSSVNKEADIALSHLEKARNQTLASVDSSSFGVRFSTSTITFYKGTTYSGSTGRVVQSIPSNVLVSYSFTGNAQEIYFNRLTGIPSATGTVTFTSRSNASTTKTIQVQATGLAEIQ